MRMKLEGGKIVGAEETEFLEYQWLTMVMGDMSLYVRDSLHVGKRFPTL